MYDTDTDTGSGAVLCCARSFVLILIRYVRDHGMEVAYM